MAYFKDFIKSFSIPTLPFAPADFQKGYFDKFNSVLRLFFAEVVNALQALFGVNGGRFINSPFGDFTDTTNQYATLTTDANILLIRNVELANAVSIVSNTKITFEYNGVYEITVSIQFTNPESAIHDVNVWFAKNGANISNTNNVVSITGSHGGVDGRTIVVTFVVLDLLASDYIEVLWQTSDVDVYIQNVPAATTPDRPASPSVILSVKHISNAL